MKIKQIIQNFKCLLPFSFNYFYHKPVKIVRKLSDQTDLIECENCGKQFGMNHSARSILPWKDLKEFYELEIMK